MWKKLFAAVAVIGLSAAGGLSQNPTNTDPSLPVASPEAPPNEPEYARADKPKKPLATPESLMEAEGFPGSIFSTPLPPSPRQMLIPAGGPLAAPIILPGGTGKHGQTIFNIIPSGDPMAANTAEEFIWGAAPMARSAPDRAWIWGSAELLLGNTTGVNVAPVVTTGVPFSAGGGGGLLGGPGTVPLFGGRKMLDDWRAGMRTEVGAWFGQSRRWGLSARFYSLFSTSDQFEAIGDGAAIINVPQLITVVTVGGIINQFPIYVSSPPLVSGTEPITGTVATTAQTTFTGGDLNLRRLLVSNELFRFELFAGYRQMHLGDELGATFVSRSGPSAGNLTNEGDDSIRTRNNFFGSQVGGLGSVAVGRLSLQATSSVALGVTASDLDFSRSRTTSTDTTVVIVERSTTGGRDNLFSVAAEGGVRLGFRITDHAKLTVGYTGIYWSKVRRAQEQFDLSDTLTGSTTHFYTNMISLGGEVKY